MVYLAIFNSSTTTAWFDILVIRTGNVKNHNKVEVRQYFNRIIFWRVSWYGKYPVSKFQPIFSWLWNRSTRLSDIVGAVIGHLSLSSLLENIGKMVLAECRACTEIDVTLNIYFPKTQPSAGCGGTYTTAPNVPI